jgi:hypothetical protein
MFSLKWFPWNQIHLFFGWGWLFNNKQKSIEEELEVGTMFESSIEKTFD